MTVNIQPELENKPQKQLRAGKSENSPFYNCQHFSLRFSVSPSPSPSCYNVCV